MNNQSQDNPLQSGISDTDWPGCLETFEVRLSKDKLASLILSDEPAQWLFGLEEMIMSQLEQPRQLLRWAVTKMEDQDLYCEGAYWKETV